uniref:Immunoglobulin V-set domain-containing protein n=1 Tax=Zosterops lateralis melanops TaxID=1220523 RepID=A0A8D2NKV1_ZOSLA
FQPLPRPLLHPHHSRLSNFEPGSAAEKSQGPPGGWRFPPVSIRVMDSWRWLNIQTKYKEIIILSYIIIIIIIYYYFTWYAPSVKGHFTISRDNGQSSVTLTMNNLQDEDSSSYFCAKGIYSSVPTAQTLPPNLSPWPSSWPFAPDLPRLIPAPISAPNVTALVMHMLVMMTVAVMSLPPSGCPQVSPQPRPFPQTSAPGPALDPFPQSCTGSAPMLPLGHTWCSCSPKFP